MTMNPAHPSRVPHPRFRLSGDRGLLIELGQAIDLETNARVRAAAAALELNAIPGLVEVIPAYCSILIIYEPDQIELEDLKKTVLIHITQAFDSNAPVSGRTVEIPVCYGGDFGPDIEAVARHNGLSVEEVITIHTDMSYPVYMLGFAPGFPYLGGLDQRLHTPRLETPRARVEAGSVGIANAQTGIYPLPSPGGWQLIGRTPLRLFAPEMDNPVPYYRPGDRLQFVSISRQEFNRLHES
jgi:KipI family sensor histidine kinase inhibitor